MSDITLPLKIDGQTIDASWFNTIRDALGGDLIPRNTSGIATDLAGSLGTSSQRWVNVYLRNLLLADSGVNSITLKSPTTLTSDYTLTFPTSLPAGNRPFIVSSGGTVSFGTVDTAGITDQAVTQAKLEARTS